MNEKERLVADGFLFSITSILSLCLTFAANILVAHYVGPTVFGVWILLQVILQYSQWSQLSIHNALNREIPLQRGKGNLARVKKICNIGWFMTIGPSAILGIALVVFSFSPQINNDDVSRSGFRYLAILVILRQIYNYMINLYKANHDFSFASEFQLVHSVFNIFLVAVLTKIYSFHGFMIAQLGAAAISIGYAFWRRTLEVKFEFQKDEFWNLFFIGFPIWLAGVFYQILVTADRTLIAGMLGSTFLGYYGVALTLRSAMMIVPSSVSQVIYPRLAERYGVTSEIVKLRNYLILPNLIQAYLMPLMIGISWFAWPLVIELFLPQFLPGLVPAQIIALGIFFFSLCGAGDFLNTVDKQYLYVAILAIVTTITWAGTWMVLKLEWGLNGVASMTVVSGFLLATLLNVCTYRLLAMKGFEIFLHLLKMYLPFAYLVIVLKVIDEFVQLPPQILSLTGYILLKIFIFMISSIPMLLWIQHRTSILSIIATNLIIWAGNFRLFLLKGRF